MRKRRLPFTACPGCASGLLLDVADHVATMVAIPTGQEVVAVNLDPAAESAFGNPRDLFCHAPAPAEGSLRSLDSGLRTGS